MIKISEIINEAITSYENNVFYWDAVRNTGYHVHIFPNGTFVCFKRTKTMIKRITAKEFESAVNNKCYLNSIGEDSYYISIE